MNLTGGVITTASILRIDLMIGITTILLVILRKKGKTRVFSSQECLVRVSSAQQKIYIWVEKQTAMTI